MTEVRDQRAAVRNKSVKISRQSIDRTERFLCALFSTVVKPVSDLRLLIFGLCAMLLAFCIPAQAQQTAKIPRIGIVSGTDNPNEAGSSIKIFRQALQDLGYSEGKNILFEYRYTEGDRDRIPGIIAELMNLKVDILFSTQAIVVRAAKQATKTIPIVMAVTPDPVAAGLVDSLARPGGNVTGLSSTSFDLADKRLELLKEIIPKLSRVGRPARSDEPSGRTGSQR
jgi:putative ABC transport system substrate-binding protein